MEMSYSWPSGNGHKSRRSQALRRLLPLALVLILLALFVFAPFMAGPRSLAVVSAYDWYCEQSSLPTAVGLTLDMPIGNMGFHPVMVTFNDDPGMSSWLGRQVAFTVDYAVGSFGLFSSHSRFYEPQDPLYGAYVGAYYIRGLGSPADAQTVMNVAAFDQRCLALPALGLDTKDAVFQADDVNETNQNIALAGYDWHRYDAAITTNGPEHTKTGSRSGYVLFGDPPPASQQYPLRQMAGRIYVTYFAGRDLTVGLYIIAKDASVIDQIDSQVLSKVRITWKGQK